MNAEEINALATSVIAFVTVLVAMVGFYNDLQQVGTNIRNIIIFELIFILSMWAFVIWIKGRSKGEE